MKPVVAYRHKLSWRLWRAWCVARTAVHAVAPFVLAGLAVALVLLAAIALTLREVVRPGEVVATGEINADGRTTAVVLVRLSDSGKVVRLESPMLSDCREGDRIKVRETRSIGRRGGYTRLRSRPAEGCNRPLS